MNSKKLLRKLDLDMFRRSKTLISFVLILLLVAVVYIQVNKNRKNLSPSISKVKTGSCPTLDSIGTCSIMCRSDVECEGAKKCVIYDYIFFY